MNLFGDMMGENHNNDHHKWYRWAYEQRYGNKNVDKEKGKAERASSVSARLSKILGSKFMVRILE